MLSDQQRPARIHKDPLNRELTTTAMLKLLFVQAGAEDLRVTRCSKLSVAGVVMLHETVCADVLKKNVSASQ